MKKAAPINIEHRKRAGEALKVREGEFGLIINSIPALAWSARPSGSTESFNRHHLVYVGLPLEQLQGLGRTVVVHSDDLSALSATWLPTMSSGKRAEAEARLRFPGEYRWFPLRWSACGSYGEERRIGESER